MSDNNATVRFHFFDFIFTPHKGNESMEDSNRILKECIQKINDERTQKQKAIVIDRHEGRKDVESRNIFISSVAFLAKEKKFKCKIALIRDNKIPTLVNKSTYSLTPFDELGDNSIAETTNFYIDVNGPVPVVCCEFNSQGPRISDIEYYFRYISSNKMLYISKACKASMHMKLPVNEVLDSITDVLKFRIKAKPNRLSYLYQEIADPFITNMNALANTIKPNSIRVDAFFRERGNLDVKTPKNIQAVSFIKRVLNAVKNDNEVIEDFEDFYLEFEKEDGSDEIFNLVRGKQEIIISCSYRTPGNLDTKELYDNTTMAFDTYLSNRNN
jgi:hypothetical protein